MPTDFAFPNIEDDPAGRSRVIIDAVLTSSIVYAGMVERALYDACADLVGFKCHRTGQTDFVEFGEPRDDDPKGEDAQDVLNRRLAVDFEFWDQDLNDSIRTTISVEVCLSQPYFIGDGIREDVMRQAATVCAQHAVEQGVTYARGAAKQTAKEGPGQ